MKFYIIIPAHNEENNIALMLNALAAQTLLPKKVIVVNDNSTDKTEAIVKTFEVKHQWLHLITIASNNKHIPGAKVINAFNLAYKTLDNDYDVICKFDADIILPNNYLERIANLFASNTTIGIAGGLAYIKKNNAWIYETVANKNHVRGPFKAYRKACFKAIGGLKPSIGWDTVDTLLAKYHGWKVVTDKSLRVKHLKPTGATYVNTSKYLQGKALYKMRYGFILTVITALKIAFKRKSVVVFKNYILGFFLAKYKGLNFIVTKDQGQFIRQLRWKGILNKLKV